MQLDKLRVEFRSGLDALTKFVFERTRPKQVGATVMTGPILARITQSFLDAINNGAVPTITSSWKVAFLELYPVPFVLYVRDCFSFDFWVALMLYLFFIIFCQCLGTIFSASIITILVLF